MSKRPGRNAPCPCGSGRKTKRCCRQGRRRRPFGDLAPPPEARLEHPPPLADPGLDPQAELRVFEVVEVVDGVGYRVVELGDEPEAMRWVADAEGSWMASPGVLFAGRFAEEAAIRLPDHPDCPLCELERQRRFEMASLPARLAAPVS